MSQQVPVVVLSGPSGSGKTTVVHRLLEESPVPLAMSISATTRPRRPAEVDGQDYYFLSPDDFERRRAAGEFLECAEVHRSGYWYGTLSSELDRIVQQGAWPLLEIALRRGYDVRIGLEDTLYLPDGHLAADNAQLVAAAHERAAQAGRL